MKDLQDTYNRPFFGTPPIPRYKHDAKVFQPNLSKAKTPANTLYNLVKRKKIIVQNPDDILDEDTRYFKADVEGDYKKIEQALNKVTPDNINDTLPPVIPVQRPPYTAPYLYYIRKDLLDIDEPELEVYTWHRRKKKTIKPKSKRKSIKKVIKKCRCK